ncbi:SH3BP5L isoform 2 [Pan troglodytes]|uniref:SH3 domain-binding protein 5 n=4 Tax=Homininae TaxID=207598 RepID=K7BR61_PANTR|nr:SH3 domain-binding protein 5-like isoform X1 [Pan paniscus]XP_009438270.3 SH3 domain-binding protein 5-like isoform X1 [Pan troglodytes]XP_018888540.1 SH3 domain-binding protein 5-like isoform X1 [Gorilla gorilla gorilla]XP_031993524.1 SH3 domain-binding protein 5-like isoform X1 [Hylobates moloch]XP_055090175.1 SH3 domain-binding protein 5-like isoform X1 [Symphalangus syndactylus]PNI12894.1 SH3BP5L isoform 2 [Pan troglodytes]
MAELRQVPGGRETPQGELRPEVVEDEVPRSPVAEEPGGGGSSSSEAKLSPREEEELDPRIQEELEHLNQASEEINQVELQLDEARTTYRRILQESARKLNTQGSHLGSCIEKARPYYEARRLAKEAQQETQKAALRYERAVSMHNAAREMVFVAEQGVMADKNRLDPTWQEMLNHATCKVNEAEEERLRGEREHQRVTRLCQQAEARVQALQKTLRRAIGKSRPYFELKAQFSQILEEHKAKVTELEQQVAQAKTRYSVALRNLEQISEQIHARRRGGLPPHPLGPRRSSPVGAEAGPEDIEDGDSGIEGAEGAGLEEGSSLGPGPAPDTDTLSLLSLRTVASDLQKCDSVEHLRGLSDHVSLDGQELGTRSGGRRGSDGGVRGGRHQRSVSL